MTFDMNTWGGDNLWGSGPSTDAVDHWLDDALRAVPLPDGFFARLSRLSDSPPERADDREHDGRLAPTRGVAGRGIAGRGLAETSRLLEASTRAIRPH